MKIIKVDDQNVILSEETEMHAIETGGGSGPTGKSAYELAVDNGFQGTVDSWLSSLSIGITVDPADADKVITNDGVDVFWGSIGSIFTNNTINWDLVNASSTIRFIRGDTAYNDGLTRQSGSITIDEEANNIRIHDGVTAGGHAVANMDDLQAVINSIATKIDSSVIDQPNGIPSLDANSKISQAQLDVVYSINGRLGDVTLGKTDVGLGNVNNTSDINKPISTAQQTALNSKLNASEKGALNGVASLNASGFVPSTQLDVVESLNGQTGDITFTKADVGLGNVDNTADISKPVSMPQQTEIDTKADIASPSFTGSPTVPTAPLGTRSTRAASTAFVLNELDFLNVGVSGVYGNAPITVGGTAVYPTININAATQTSRGTLSAADKTKIDNIEAGAQVNTVTSVEGRTGDVNVTKVDVGLGNVANYAMASTAEQTAATATDKYMSPQGVRTFIESGDYVLDGGTF